LDEVAKTWRASNVFKPTWKPKDRQVAMGRWNRAIAALRLLAQS